MTEILKRLMLAYRQRMDHLEAGMKRLDDLDRAFTWRRWWHV